MESKQQLRQVEERERAGESESGFVQLTLIPHSLTYNKKQAKKKLNIIANSYEVTKP